MLTLTIRTDKPEAEIAVYDSERLVSEDCWLAHRQLAETLHRRLLSLLEHAGYTMHDITAIIAYKGPGSFTGLRIGLSVANALAYSLSVPVIGETGADWQQAGIARLNTDEQRGAVVLPEYGALPHITQQKK